MPSTRALGGLFHRSLRPMVTNIADTGMDRPLFLRVPGGFAAAHSECFLLPTNLGRDRFNCCADAAVFRMGPRAKPTQTAIYRSISEFEKADAENGAMCSPCYVQVVGSCRTTYNWSVASRFNTLHLAVESVLRVLLDLPDQGAAKVIRCPSH
jgi:hypothetical protein